MEAGQGPISLLRTVPYGTDGVSAERPYAISDVRGTSDGSLSIVGRMTRGFDLPTEEAVWSVTPGGQVRLDASDHDLPVPSGSRPHLTADNFSHWSGNIGFLPILDGRMFGLVVDAFRSILTTLDEGDVEMLSAGDTAPAPIFRDRVVLRQYSDFAAEPEGNLLIDWQMTPTGDFDALALWTVDAEGTARVVLQGQRPLFAASGVRVDGLVTYAPQFPSTGGDGRGQRIDAEGRVAFNRFPYVFLGEPVGDCPQDVNDDGTVDVHDLLDYLGRFRIGENYAEWTRDFDITVADLLAFLGDFRRGCPEEPVQEMRPTRAR